MRRRREAGPSEISQAVALALIYLRVSSDEQAEEGASLPAQLAECHRHIGRQPWRLDGEPYQDVLTGLKDARPAYQALLARVRELRAQGHSVVVVVADLDRLGRNTMERVRCWDELVETLHVELHSVRHGGVVPELVHTVLAAVAKEEVKKISMRVSRTWANLSEQGWYKCGASTAWGYRSRPRTAEEQAAGAPASVIEPDPEVRDYV